MDLVPSRDPVGVEWARVRTRARVVAFLLFESPKVEGEQRLAALQNS